MSREKIIGKIFILEPDEDHAMVAVKIELPCISENFISGEGKSLEEALDNFCLELKSKISESDFKYNNPEIAHTWDWEEHPEDYNGPCACQTCRSYD